MKRRIKIFALFSLTVLFLCSCRTRAVLLFLNWGEYIDEDMIAEFEETYHCEVIMDLGDSNEIFYSKVRGGTTLYDVVVPSDYMVEKMVENDLLAPIDFDKLANYDSETCLEGVQGIRKTMEQHQTGISDYCVPYLWGTWGMMYSTLKEGLEEAVTTADNPWRALFDRSILPTATKVAMYDSHLHAYAVACKYLGLDSTTELTEDSLNRIYDAVQTMDYDAWGTDSIKKDIVAQNLDLGFMWTGDFLYYYCENVAKKVLEAYLAGDVAIASFSEMIEVLTGDERIYTANGRTYQVGFDIYIPDDTIAFCDHFVIPKDSAHYDLALKFIDFMCGRKPVDAAFSNAYYVSYNTPFIDVYEDMVALATTQWDEDEATLFEEEVKMGTDPYDSSLFWKVYDQAIGIAFEKYYPKEEQVELPDGSIRHYKGEMLSNFNRKYVNTINNLLNNARS